MSFCPPFIHSNFKWSLTWLRAAEEAGLAGSALRVLQVFLGKAARGRSGLSRHEISRLGRLPLSTARDGVAGLLGAGWIREPRKGNLSLVLHEAQGEGLRPEKGGRISPPRKVPEGNLCPPIPPPAPPAEAVALVEELPPEKKAIQAELLRIEGCTTAGARAAAAATTLGIQAVVDLVADLRDLVAQGKVKHFPGMAVWAVKRGARTAKSIRRQARRARGESVRRQKVGQPPPPPEPIVISPNEWREMVQDYTDLLAEHPPEFLARAKAAGRAGHAAFCRAAGEILRNLGARP